VTAVRKLQGGSNMTGTICGVNKPQFVPVIFEPPCKSKTAVETAPFTLAHEKESFVEGDEAKISRTNCIEEF
jgi:hypothetical protein